MAAAPPPLHISPELAEHVAALCLAASRARRVAAEAQAAGRVRRSRQAERLCRRFWHRAQTLAALVQV